MKERGQDEEEREVWLEFIHLKVPGIPVDTWWGWTALSTFTFPPTDLQIPVKFSTSSVCIDTRCELRYYNTRNFLITF